MKKNQLNRGELRKVLYIENKDGDIDGVEGCIGWVTFSQSGKTVYYRGRTLKKAMRGIRGNFYDENTGEEYWISGIKIRGSNQHWAEPVNVRIDSDALDEYKFIKAGKKSFTPKPSSINSAF
ncbi:MAG: hypothetical protein HOP36_10835 [Methyloglobulus sp.]|nr:hypothetical protein [Methyloglobulus sp.]